MGFSRGSAWRTRSRRTKSRMRLKTSRRSWSAPGKWSVARLRNSAEGVVIDRDPASGQTRAIPQRQALRRLLNPHRLRARPRRRNTHLSPLVACPAGPTRAGDHTGRARNAGRARVPECLGGRVGRVVDGRGSGSGKRRGVNGREGGQGTRRDGRGVGRVESRARRV